LNPDTDSATPFGRSTVAAAGRLTYDRLSDRAKLSGARDLRGGAVGQPAGARWLRAVWALSVCSGL